MTTMFVQLRRVVYLLVLLQCCTCVAYAQGDTTSTHSVEEGILMEMGYLKAKMEAEKKKVETLRVSVKTVTKEWSEASNRAQSATTTAKEVEKLLVDTKGRVLHLSENENKNMSELKEVLRKAVDAAKEITDAAEKANLTANKINNTAHEIQEEETVLLSAQYHVERIVNEHIDKEEETSVSGEKKKIKELADECKKKVEEVQTFLMDVSEVTKSAHSLAEEAKKQAAVASDAAAELQRIINETYLECPDMKEELDREIEEEKRRFSETNTTNEGENSPHNNKELDDSHPNKQNEKETKDQNTNSTEAETGSHANAQQQQNQQGSENQNEEGKVETQENNNSSQSNTPTSSHSSASGTSSQNMLTNTSSASIHLNISQLSDSSSSPALVHSPLLLLLVSMCVLGCTLVC
ncbi:uncharacterized protein TM35_000122730 [Trypanosoma theileri]|uniref:Mucin-associated surface protein (MASP) n=1 Tax=Trypanosoma theileri TaxID=67003 RepID=A0A1X0NY68_9TRYP|nr:uncharacterized protein TM35_000122730 [Trypanosoma theileri]ORC89498.1 hypothetical protein TM35_000122730 [Trypanosoma theileri]